MKKQISILIAKPGLDGHDKGAKIISYALKEAGMNVIYSGLHQTLKEIVALAGKNSVDAIGLSIMTGTHLHICKKCIEELEKRSMKNIKVFVGGVIPRKDIENLTNLGVEGVFPSGTKISEIIQSIQALL